MAEMTMADVLLGRPMPEVYDRVEPEGIPFMKAFGAGAIDPFGITGYAVDKLGGGDWFGRRMKELRAEQPIAAGMGTGLTTGLAINPAFGAYSAIRNAGLGTLGHGIPLSAYLSGAGPGILPPSMMVGGGIGKTLDELGAVKRPPRAQGSYPPDSAY